MATMKTQQRRARLARPPTTIVPAASTGYVKNKIEKTTKFSENLVSSQQMLLDNIRHLKNEVDKTNREIKRTRNERLYADMFREDAHEERDMPYNSRFYKPKIELDMEREANLKSQTSAKAQ